MSHSQPSTKGLPPFDSKRLDALMEAAGIDILLASSRHNTRYLLGGYSYFFFDGFDAVGISRYLPIVLYFRGRPEDAVYIGNAMEASEHELGKFWTPEVHTRSWGSLEAIEAAVGYIAQRGGPVGTVGIEPAFLPFDAGKKLSAGLSGWQIADGQRALELLRAIKTPAELDLVREASERVVQSMLAVIAANGPGISKNDLVEALADNETKRGLTFEYCLISAGTSLNRSPSDYVLKPGDIFSLDSGGNYAGYLGDLCRMGIMGEPDAELEDLMGEVLAIQDAARGAVASGVPGGAIYAAANPVVARSPYREDVEFVAHGMGLISHEAPRLAPSGFPYKPEDAGLPLQPGMVLSIETAIRHPKRGMVKIEDTLAVTADGVKAYGDAGRGWMRGCV